MKKQLILIFGDQLDHQINSLKACNPEQDVILMGEIIDEATHIKHHQQKLVLIFSAMRQFAAELQAKGFQVDYHYLNQEERISSFTELVKASILRHQPKQILLTKPSEHRVMVMVDDWIASMATPVVQLEDDRFFCTPEAFKAWANGRKQLRMEYFYREMRKKHSVLMDGTQPIGKQWNFDALNRKPPPKQGLKLPDPCMITPNITTKTVLKLVAETFSDHFGDISTFHYATNRQEALQVLNHFVKHQLPHFGDYQDAMLIDEPWMYHSHLGFYLNCGLLRPDECVQRAESAYHQGAAPLPAVEGFIRQILGWREFIRGIYWLKMPDYQKQNHLKALRPLPSFYWTGDTPMRCMQQCIAQTQKYAYAHHIQRLMVLGNFALLAGIDPDAVNEWFWVVYADAYEWVERPNVSGMALFADGGVLASKPYAASGAYIHKMSNYCQNCQFNVKIKTGPDACPFNYLYWDFIRRHAETLSINPRMGLIYKAYARLDETQKKAITASAANFLATLS